MNQFLNANHTEPFEFPQIKYHDITFICIAYPNGIKRDDEGYISLVIKMLSKPKDIEEIVTSCHVYLQNKLMYKEHITFNSNCSQFLLGNSSLCDSKLSEYRDVNSLVFGMDIQIVGVNYHEQGERFDNGKWTDYLVYSQPIPLPQYIKYEWKLDDLILREMRKDSNRIFYYENGTNWTMLLYKLL
ncbi:MAG: hypothetical protein GY755_08210 [Chloroflexi bacterium]|nr:hypothetical protein [Chloroflexota bacterium]